MSRDIQRPGNRAGAANAVGRGLGKGIAAGYTLLARGAGGVVRAGSGRKSARGADDLDGTGAGAGHSHRRDGIALGLLALAVLIAVGVWFGAAGPAGAFVEAFTRALIGAPAIILPVALAAGAVVLMRRPPRPELRGRYLGAGLLIGLPLLGLIHLLCGQPMDFAGRSGAGGFVGYVVGSPLTAGASSWVSVPVLLLSMAFGVLLISGRTVREVIDGVAGYLGLGAVGAEYDDESEDELPWDDEDDDPYAAADDLSDEDTDDWRASSVTGRRAVYASDPFDNYPPDPEVKPARRAARGVRRPAPMSAGDMLASAPTDPLGAPAAPAGDGYDDDLAGGRDAAPVEPRPARRRSAQRAAAGA
ncbi:MAG: DNA translocase FtsK 4TM domain-containing protein, partial [Gordonia sp. (in: high G+C Gram-positive bacteria)]